MIALSLNLHLGRSLGIRIFGEDQEFDFPVPVKGKIIREAFLGNDIDFISEREFFVLVGSDHVVVPF